ncbi:hypothetical protein LINGRAHAP2_LOCUS32034, partial [Linum grandiflorum]
QFKYLRVLDLEEALVKELPDNIDILFNLRFLNLFATREGELKKYLAETDIVFLKKGGGGGGDDDDGRRLVVREDGWTG